MLSKKFERHAENVHDILRVLTEGAKKCVWNATICVWKCVSVGYTRN
jgi:hypothetical protein